MKLYLAGPLFGSADREFNRQLATALREWAHEVFLPQADAEENVRLGETATASDIFVGNKKGIDWCEIVIANMDGPDPDSGTAWECGYAYGTDKRVITFRTDFRSATDLLAPFNIMLAESSEVLKASPNITPERLAHEIDSLIFYGEEER